MRCTVAGGYDGADQLNGAGMGFVISGTVYGTLLNFRGEVEALRPQMDQPPYNSAPRAPVLYVKTANTWSANGADIPVPTRLAQVEVGATLAMVMGQGGQVAGYVLMNDLSAPHTSFFRPPVKFKCLDGFLGVGAALVPFDSIRAISSVVLEVRVDGALKQSVRFSELVRDASRLLADVSEFMTLHPGDALMLGCDAGRPLAGAGQTIEIRAPGFGTLTNRLVAEPGP
jgi:5-oxopent-3-ene-1,2,5-tricarboxylate decarboxylase/2-hydroxyhepta-2,4-diene-1,7-dioate isomerase